MSETIDAMYARLEADMPSYEDYGNIPVADTAEPLVPIVATEGLRARTMRDDARLVTGERTFVRQGVYDRLVKAGGELALRAPGCQLEVGYGYRSLAVQRTRFAAELERVRGLYGYEGEELRQAAHRQIAVPEAAGHPAGAAVDIRIIGEDEKPLDFGTKIWEFVKPTYTFSSEVSDEARQNRMLLRSVMTAAGFAPFDGEWWHFSYGDKEWAYWYDRPQALYDQIEFTATDV